MLDSIAYIAAALKAARQQKGISQRALGSKTGIPQGHLSKIENGIVDLQVSSLIEISRVLDLELVLIPRSLVPVVETLKKGTKKGARKQIPAYNLEQDNEGEEDDV